MDQTSGVRGAEPLRTLAGYRRLDGKVVFGQIFMWNGYTGVHWNVITDVEPSDGYRLVYHTFPAPGV